MAFLYLASLFQHDAARYGMTIDDFHDTISEILNTNLNHYVEVETQIHMGFTPGMFAVGGEFSYDDTYQYKLILHLNDFPFSGISGEIAREIAREIINVAVHEYQHWYQDQARGDLIVSTSNKSCSANQKYLGDFDEIGHDVTEALQAAYSDERLKRLTEAAAQGKGEAKQTVQRKAYKVTLDMLDDEDWKKRYAHL